MSEAKSTQETANNYNEVLAAVLSYVTTEGNRLYKTRMKDNVDYNSVMDKVVAFDTVEKHVRSLLKNCS
jgi:hypothetical protein